MGVQRQQRNCIMQNRQLTRAQQNSYVIVNALRTQQKGCSVGPLVPSGQKNI